MTIKSRERVRKFGEVFTPQNIVADMVDLCEPHISQPSFRVLEPACGNGNFLVEILNRKFLHSEHALDCIMSIGSLYGVDILPDNIEECHNRLLELVPESLRFFARARFRRNIVQGDFLNGQDKIWFLKKEALMLDYEKAVMIDPDNLDKEWRKQACLTLACMDALAEARRELDRAKEDYSLVVAEVDKVIRESADKKPTEKALEGLVLTDPRVMEASNRVIAAKYDVNMLEAARSGLDSKREALSNLVKLHGMGYFAEPEADIVSRGVLDDMREQEVKRKVQKSLSKSGKSEETPRSRRTKE